MKKNQVQIGGTYVAKVSGKIVSVRLDAEGQYGGWQATNLETGRTVHIKSAQRLRREVRAKAEPVAAKAYDPSRCATPRCKGEPVLTLVDRPLCQRCWERHCEEPSTGDACRPEEFQTPEQENAMSKKKTTKKTSTKKTTSAKANGKTEAKAPASKAKTPKPDKPKRISALDAAATVLKKAGKPLRSQEMIDAMASQGLWKSPGGKTPHATLYAAILREITVKGGESRFKKVERGQFAYAGGKN